MNKIKDFLIKIKGSQTKVDKKFWQDFGDLPVISQDSTYNINSFVNKQSFSPITDLPLIIFGDHTCMFKYIDFEFVRGADGTQLIKPNDSFDTKFFYYLLQNIKKDIPESNKYQRHYKYLKEMDISKFLFSIGDQQKIASILSSLDDKIKVNNKINNELEQIAKTLYDYWFVQFDFPDKNGNPYKTSDGKMVWSEEFKKEIPKEWTVASLYKNSLTSILKPKIDIFEGSKEYLATANINGREIIKGDLITHENRESRANMQPVVNSVWFAKMKDSKKHIFVGKYSKDIIENNIFSTGFLGLKCEDLAFEYIASFISSDIFELTKDIISHGATMQGIGNDDLKIIKLVIPRKEVLMSYKKITEDVYKKIDLIRQENKRLEEVRDWLLPMLMNGQVTIM